MFATYCFAREMGFADSSAAAARYAQKLAMGSGCDTRFVIDSAGYALWQRTTDCRSGAFSRAVPKPGGDTWALSAPQGVALGNLDIYFDAQGRPRLHSNGTLLTVAGGFAVGARTVQVEPVTGLVHIQ